MTIQAEIDQAKLNLNSGFFANVLSPANDEPALISALEKLGRLPSDFDGSLLLPLLNHSNPKIRNLAVKNIGKLRDESFLAALSDFANAETNTFARREAVSALGRLKTPKAISILKRFLADSDPKVILQALRGLLYFRDREDVRNFLTPLCEHPNELIREHAIRELNGQRRDKFQSLRSCHESGCS